jgi:hypothetical protein
MTTKMGAWIANGGSATPAASRFMAALSGKRPRKPIVVPGIELAGYLTILGTTRSIELEGDAQRAMKELGLEPGPMTLVPYELARATRFLTDAVFEDEALTKPLGTIAEWGSLSKEVIAEVWAMYSDLCCCPARLLMPNASA